MSQGRMSIKGMINGSTENTQRGVGVEAIEILFAVQRNNG